MSPNGVFGAVSKRRLLSVGIAAVAAVAAAVAVAMLSFGVVSASHGEPHIRITLNGDRLEAELSNPNEVTEDSSSWEWISYDAATADSTGSDFVGCLAGSFGLSGNGAPDPYNSGAGSSVKLTSDDNGLTYCFLVADTDGNTNTKKYPDSGDPAINVSANSNSNSQSNSAEQSNNGGQQAGTVPDTGVEEDLLLGGLFILGVTASVACAKIWLDTYKRQRQPKV